MEEAHRGIVYNINTDRLGTRVVTSSEDRVVRLFRVAGGKCQLVQEMMHHKAAVFDAIFVGESVVSCSYDGQVVIWRSEGGRYVPKTTKSLFQGSINCICCIEDDDGYRVFCGCSDGRLRVLKVSQRGEEVEDYYTHRYGITSVTSSRDYVISGGMDCVVKIWSPADMSLVHELKDHTEVVRDCKISQESFGFLVFATCSEDGTVCIYTHKSKPREGGGARDLSGHEVEIGGATFERHRLHVGEPCYKLSWSKSGYALCVGYGENKVRTYVPSEQGVWEEAPLIKQ